MGSVRQEGGLLNLCSFNSLQFHGCVRWGGRHTGLLLALCSEVTPSSAWGTIWDVEDQTPVSFTHWTILFWDLQFGKQFRSQLPGVRLSMG